MQYESHGVEMLLKKSYTSKKIVVPSENDMHRLRCSVKLKGAEIYE
jgi:hypothetical protein